MVRPWLVEYISEGPDGVDVRLRRREASPHGIHRNVTRAQGTPGLDASAPFIFGEPLNADPGINAEVFTIATSLFEIPMELLNVGFDPVVRSPTRWHPAVAEACGAFEHGLCGTPEPDRDRTLNRQRIDASIVDDVLGGLVRDERLSPELA